MVKIIPAATTCVIREKDGIEVLLLKRNKSLKFAPGFWVFPGGRIDREELTGAHSEQDAAIMAAIRETAEESHLDIRDSVLHDYYHWTTPAGGSRRFGTWFFHALYQDTAPVKVDGGEIVDHVWLTVEELLDGQAKGDFPMLPPTYISLQRLKNATTYADVITEFERTGRIHVTPVISYKGTTYQSMYHGDAGYATADPNIGGPRHRLHSDLVSGEYRFEYSDDCAEDPITGGIIF